MDTNNVDTTVAEVIKILSESKRPVVYICNSDYDDFSSLWHKVLEKLRSLEDFRVRRRTITFILPMGNSDGEVSHDENHEQYNYYLTRN